jgi:hypothetical protein
MNTRAAIPADMSGMHEAFSFFPKRSACVGCDDGLLSCSCPAGESCRYTIQSSCEDPCPRSYCVARSDTSESNDQGGGSSGPDPGAIAGGVIGGLAAIALLSYLVWRFVVRPRRSQIPTSIYASESHHSRDAEKDTGSRMTRRSSTHTVHSIASTVLTRASNIIQIAYIPGVTNRATPTSPNVLVPPVPPIPMHHAEANRESTLEDPHFFVPGDLRDSTYSGYSGYSDRTSYAHTSYAPRSSIASTVYGKQAQVLTPASMGMRAKPTMVSVKSFGSPANTPPMPSVDFEKFQPNNNSRPKSGASAFSVGSTFLNSANTATPARAQVVKVGSGLKKIEISNKGQDGHMSAGSAYTSTPDTPSLPTARSSNAVTVIDESPSVDQGPFSDPPLRVAGQSTLGAVAEDETESRMSDRSSRPTVSTQRGTSPFGDEHAFKG